MTEAARVSIAIEATGLEKTTGDMAKLEKAGEKAAASVRASMGGIEKNMAAVEAMFTKATSEIVGAVTKLDANLSKSFAGLETSMAKAMKAMQANTAPATAAVQQMQTSVSSDLMQIGVVADKMAEAVRDSMGGIAPAVAEASAAISRSSQAMGAFDTASASMARSAAALETAVRGVAEMQAKVADQLARKPANDNPFQPQVKGADELRAKYDALFAIGLKYRKDVEEIRKSHEAGSISLDTMNRMIATAGERATATQDAYVRMNAHIMQAGGAAKLSAFQMQGLGYQINDMATMLALGASPFQIIASQAGQVVQVLGDHPGGMKGSLSAIGSGIASFARAIPAAGYVVAGLSAAVGALWYLTSGPEARKAEESVKGFEDAVKRLEGKWRGAADAAKEHYRVAREKTDTPNTAVLDTQAELAKLKADYKAAVNDLDTSDVLSGRILRPFAGSVSDARREISGVYADLRKGKITADDAAAAMLRIRLDPKADVYARNFAEEIRRALGPLQAMEDHVQALNNSIAQLYAPKGTRGRIDPVQRVFDDRFGGSDDAMKGLREGLEAQTKEMTEADKAAVNYTKTVEDQRRSIAGSVSDLRLQIETFGQSEGAQAAARMQADLLAEAERAAADAKQKVDPALIEFIKAQSSEYGRLTDQLDALSKAEQKRKQVAQALSDIDFDRSLIGLSDGEQNIRQQLRSLDVDFNSFEGQRIAAGHRLNDQLRATQEEMRRVGEEAQDAFGSFVDALVQGDSAMDALLSTFGRFGQQLSSAGFDKLFGGLFGTGNPAGSAAGIASSASAAATRLSTIGASLGGSRGVGSDYASSVASPVKISTADLASASGQIMAYSSRFNSSVDNRLLTILNTAASRFDMPVTAISGLRPGDPRYHGKGLATDVQIYGANGQALGNYQDGATFRTYERFAQLSKQVQQELFPELEGMLRWGGYFSGGKGKYGALDTMHFDLAGNRVGMGGGSWENGLTAAQRARFPDASSMGMGANDNVIARGVSSGMVDYSRKAASGAVPGVQPSASAQAALNGGWDGFTGVDQGMNKLGAGMQALGAGIGIFSNGYQSQSPIGGALSGVMGGFQAGSTLGPLLGMAAGAGPIGAVVGGIVGLVGGLFGKSKAKKDAQKQKWAQAEEAWQQNLPQFRQFEDTVTRTERGPLSSKIKEMQETLKQFDDLAKKGKGDRNNDQIRRVRAELANYVAFLSDNFIRDLPTIIGDLGMGQGLDTGFTKARDNVMQMADSYRGFMKDITDAYAIPVDQRAKILTDFEAAKALAGEQTKRIKALQVDGKGNPSWTTKTEVVKKDDPAALAAAIAKRDQDLAAFDAKYGDAIQRMNEQLEAARNAAIEGLLRIVSGDIPEQSDIEKAIQEATGAASGLRTALVDLGMSADETAAAIDKALGQRMAKMRTDFEDSIRGEINDIDGKGYLNSVKDLLKTRDTMMADAQRLGADGSLVASYFQKSAQEIVNGAELTGTAFADLIKMFPELAGAVTAFALQGKQLAQSNLDTARNDLDRSYNAEVDTINKLVSARQDEIGKLEDTISGLKGYRDGLEQFRKNVLTNDMSTLSPEAKLAEAKRQLDETAGKAKGGDEDARGELTSAMSAYLEQAKNFFASSQGYTDAFDYAKALTEGQIASSDQALTEANKQLSALNSQNDLAEKQLDVLKNQYDAILGTNDGIKSMADALAAYATAMVAARDAGISVGGTVASPQYQDETLRFVETQFKALLGRSADMGALDFFSAMRAKGATADEIIASIKQSSEYKGGKVMGGIVGRYAEGGMIGNGIWNRDSVLARYAGGGSVALAGGEYVVRAPMVNPRTLPALEAMNRGYMPANGNGNAEMVAELRALRAEVRQLRATVAEGELANVAATREGVAAQQAMTQSAKRAAAA